MEDKHAKQQEALRQIKAVVDDGNLATINGRDYKLTAFNHRKRRKIFAFYTKYAADLQRGDFSFLDTADWDEIERLLNDATLAGPDQVQISKQPNYWDEHADDFLQFVGTMLPVACYPFLSGSLTR